MKRKLYSLITAMLISAVTFSQVELGENEHYATLIFPNGTEQEVVLLANLEYPWLYQKKITTVDREVFESGIKIKGKHKISYKAKDLSGYRIGEQLFEVRKYSDMSSIGMNSLAALYFLEVVESGKVSLYNYYQEPYVEEGSAPVTKEELNQKFRNHPQVLIYKDGMKVKEVNGAKLKNYFSDNQQVMKKYEEGEYGNVPKESDKSKVGKFLDKLAEDNEDFVKKVVRDYNKLEA